MAAPKLRFNHDNSLKDWSETPLGDIANVVMGQSPKGDSYSDVPQDSSLVLIQGNADMKEGKVSPRIYTTHPTKLSYPGDIILSVRAPVGAVAISDIRSCIGRGVCAIKGPDVLYHYFQYMNDTGKWLSLSQGSTFESINSKDIQTLKICLPSDKLEQNKITKFFTLLNHRIEKQNLKIEALQARKKALMQKIFNQELRFKDNDGEDFPEWTTTTLYTISNSIEYGMNSAAKEYDGENRYLRITDIDDLTRRYISESPVSPQGQIDESFRMKQGDIVFTRTGASTGKTYLYKDSDGKMYYAGFLIEAVINSSLADARFIYYQTLTVRYKNWVKIMSMRSGQPGINAKEYGSYVLDLPSIKEQQKVADFLSIYDEKINKEEAKLKAMKQQKKGFLQQMFI